MEIIKQTHGASMNEGHLGGWAFGGDGGTYYPKMWEYLVNTYKIKSVLDVGCGRGYSAKFFKSLGCDILGVDGSEAARDLTLLDESEFFHHDYTKGIIQTNASFDLAWCCEFVEHVEEQYLPNFMNSFQLCKFVAMTFAGPGQGGHHHVNENTQDYWVNKMNDFGFKFLKGETDILRSKANEDKEDRSKDPEAPYFISHFVERGLFFINNSR